MSYDPRECGAECDRCPLGPNAPWRLRYRKEGRDEGLWRPAPPENPDAPFVVFAQTPGREEHKRGRPLVGASGVELTRAVQAAGYLRSDVGWDSVIACAPPGWDWRRYELRMAAYNRKRKQQGRDPLPSPVECCAPRVRRRLAKAEGILPVGKLAYQRTSGSSSSIEDVRGTIAEVLTKVEDDQGQVSKKRLKVAPTIASFLHRRRWLPIMRIDVERALNWFNDRLGWEEPTITITMNPGVIKAFFDRMREKWKNTPRRRRPLVYDLETDGIRPLRTALRCAGFGDPDEALVIPIRDLSGKPLWSKDNEAFLARYLSTQLQDEALGFSGHNAAVFDHLVWESWTERVTGERFTPDLVDDTVAISAITMPEHPNTLGFNATVHSREGTPAWKADHTATDARNMRELCKYCALDNVINARILGRMRDLVAEKHQEKPYQVLRNMQGVCANFHRVGVPVYLPKVRDLYEDCRQREVTAFWNALHAVEQAGGDLTGYGKPRRKSDPCHFNPNSGDHLRDLIFGQWGCYPPVTLSAKECYTDGGDFSVSKAVLIALQYDPQLTSSQQAALRAILVFKKWAKRRGTAASYGRRHWTGEYRNKKRPDGSVVRIKKIVGHTVTASPTADVGRIHGSWAAHVTPVSRVSCSKPNLVNTDKFFRSLFRAPDGYSLVYADWSALHFRLMAALWKIPRLIEACTPTKRYPRGKDAHSLLAGMLFKDKYWKASGHPDPARPAAIGDYTGAAKDIRDPIKNYGYAMGYEAKPPTIYRVMASAMKDDGTRKFPDLTEQMIEGFSARTLALEPEWEQNWTRLKHLWMTQGYIEEPVNGRRCWFEDGYVTDGYFGREVDGLTTDSDLDSFDIGGNVGNQIINFEILGAEGSFASNVTLEFVEAVPFEYAGPGTGLIHQNYDSMMALVPDKDVKRVSGIMHDCMNVDFRGIPMIADVSSGKTWKDVS